MPSKREGRRVLDGGRSLHSGPGLWQGQDGEQGAPTAWGASEGCGGDGVQLGLELGGCGPIREGLCEVPEVAGVSPEVTLGAGWSSTPWPRVGLAVRWPWQ